MLADTVPKSLFYSEEDLEIKLFFFFTIKNELGITVRVHHLSCEYM